MKWSQRKALKDQSIENQEHYFNLYYQVSEQAATNFINMIRLVPLFYSLAITGLILKMWQPSIIKLKALTTI